MATGTVTKPAVRSVWATSATVANIADPGDAFGALGWPLSATPPARQFFNWQANYSFNGVRYQCSRGLPDWDATETFYSVGSVVIGDNGLIYAALQAGPSAAVPGTNSNKTPSTSPTYWGSVGVPTATAGDNTAKAASTAFVTGAVATSAAVALNNLNTEIANRQAAVAAEAATRVTGDSNVQTAATNYTNAKTAPLAPLNSPALTGQPTGPTAAVNTQTAQLATCAFANPAASVTANGYARLPSGVLLQWGVVVGTNTGASAVSVTFPVSFSQCFVVVASSKRAATGVVGTGQTQNLSNSSGVVFSTNGALIVCDRDVDGVLRASWFAIGR